MSLQKHKSDSEWYQEKISKQNQEFISNKAAIGFEHYHLK